MSRAARPIDCPIASLRVLSSTCSDTSRGTRGAECCASMHIHHPTPTTCLARYLGRISAAGRQYGPVGPDRPYQRICFVP